MGRLNSGEAEVVGGDSFLGSAPPAGNPLTGATPILERHSSDNPLLFVKEMVQMKTNRLFFIGENGNSRREYAMLS